MWVSYDVMSLKLNNMTLTLTSKFTTVTIEVSEENDNNVGYTVVT